MLSRYEINGESILGFESPITFQDHRVGSVALGIAEKPLTQVARLSMMLMLVLVLVTVLAVAIAMYFVANWFAAPVRLLSESMQEIGKGRFDHRIHEQRNDEFGQLFQTFDRMAAALQARAETSPVAAPMAQDDAKSLGGGSETDAAVEAAPQPLASEPRPPTA